MTKQILRTVPFLVLALALPAPSTAQVRARALSEVVYATRVAPDNSVYVDVENETRMGIRVTSVEVVFYDKRKRILEKSEIECETDCLVSGKDAESFGPIEGPRGWDTVEVTNVFYEDAVEDDEEIEAESSGRADEPRTAPPPSAPRVRPGPTPEGKTGAPSARPSSPAPAPSSPAPAPSSTASGPRESIEGYAEWWRDGVLIVDGQRVRLAANAKFKAPKAVKSFGAIPLGYEVKVKGRRTADGVLLAEEVEAKENGTALFETDLRDAFDEMEQKYVNERRMYEEDDNGKREEYGRLLTSGPQVERGRRSLRRLIPGYLEERDFRIYVVENKEWNAMAAPNDSMYVFSGLLADMDDDEVAIVLGHELAHATHEHSRKSFKKDMLIQLAAAGVAAIAEEAVKGENKKAVVQLAALLGASAWSNGYGRSREDQADRVGMRYAYEAGFDVRKGPRLWNRFAEKYGDAPKLLNFFLGDHSVAEDRARNLTRELVLNYSR